jgi:hypothetical protein
VADNGYFGKLRATIGPNSCRRYIDFADHNSNGYHSSNRYRYGYGHYGRYNNTLSHNNAVNHANNT